MTTAEAKSPLSGLSKSVDHITVPILDMDRAERFYVDVLGAELLERFDAQSFLKHRPDRADELKHRNSPLHVSVRLGAGPRLDLFLQDYGQPATEQAHPHIAFEVDGRDLDGVKAHLQSAGIPVDGPRRLGPPGQASLYFIDPFGNKLEFMTNAYPGHAPVGPPDWSALTHQWKG
jgi:catechol 2,3-dioxygenase-like lactoylglutathione lyase family enzyme